MRPDHDRHRGSRPVHRHRVRVAVLALGTAGGLVALFRYDGALPGGVVDAALGELASDGSPVAAAGRGDAGAADGAPAGGAGADPGADAVVDGGRPAGAAASPAGGAAPTARPSARARSVLGAAADTQWGVVQVRIGVRDGKIVSAQAVQAPRSNPTSVSISGRALPLLAEEAVAAQDGDIDAVSGATITSGGYRESLQSAIDKAGLV